MSKVIKNKLGEDGKSIIVLEEHELWFRLRRVGSVLLLLLFTLS